MTIRRRVEAGTVWGPVVGYARTATIRAREPHRCEHVYLEHASPVVDRLLDRAEGRRARVVDEGIDAARVVDHSRDRVVGGGGIRIGCVEHDGRDAVG